MQRGAALSCSPQLIERPVLFDETGMRPADLLATAYGNPVEGVAAAGTACQAVQLWLMEYACWLFRCHPRSLVPITVPAAAA